MSPQTGRVVATHGRHFLVESAEGVIECVMRGKKGGVACNDRVSFHPTGPGAGVIEAILPRANLLYRSDAQRAKLLAADVDQVLLVSAAVPTPREELLIRCLVAAEAAGIPALILVNKTDLAETAAYLERLRAYAALGYPLVALSAKSDVAPLLPWIADKVSVLVGASGMGKSTLVNALHPRANAATAEVSASLDAGTHTTTHTRLYRLAGGGAIIDSPGMQEFGLRHLDLDALQAAFPEFRRLAGQCRFHNCRHLREPNCAVLAAVESGAILRERWRVYQTLLRENSQGKY
ncbi:MAG: ribosome small subunit-dependent GTPase A [Thiobacillaceae bacterium]|nr:ribosome small subunit-dependent GTPase A [Thiobacillaceae bacterium]